MLGAAPDDEVDVRPPTPAFSSARRAASRPMTAVVSAGPATGLRFTPYFSAITSSGRPVVLAMSAALRKVEGSQVPSPMIPTCILQAPLELNQLSLFYTPGTWLSRK